VADGLGIQNVSRNVLIDRRETCARAVSIYPFLSARDSFGLTDVVARCSTFMKKTKLSISNPLNEVTHNFYPKLRRGIYISDKFHGTTERCYRIGIIPPCSRGVGFNRSKKCRDSN
jgi:hypothetical protein